VKIELTTAPSAEDAKTISQGLIQFNHAIVADLEPIKSLVKFSVFSRDPDGNVNGGLRATCFWNLLDIELLWLAEEARGQGIGSLLVRKAEQFAIDKGIEQALVTTTTWQARPFYEKLGYKLKTTISDHPKGHSCHFLSKRLIVKV